MNIVRRAIDRRDRGRGLRGRRARAAAVGHAHQGRQHAGADRAARRRRRIVHKLVGEIYVERAEQARRPARPAGRVDREGRPVQARPRAHAVRAADHRRQGRPADGAVRHRRDPLGDGRGAALQQGADAPHVRHARRSPSTRCSSRPWSLGSDPGDTFTNTLFDALAATPKPPKTIAIVTSKFPSIHFMSLGAREVDRRSAA